MLEIKPTTHRDSGRYECQISTTPPTSHVVYLKIAGMSRIVVHIKLYYKFILYFMYQQCKITFLYYAFRAKNRNSRWTGYPP